MRNQWDRGSFSESHFGVVFEGVIIWDASIF